jgi:hypothetical protein
MSSMPQLRSIEGTTEEEMEGLKEVIRRLRPHRSGSSSEDESATPTATTATLPSLPLSAQNQKDTSGIRITYAVRCVWRIG